MSSAISASANFGCRSVECRRAVVKHLYEASRSGDGWCFGKTLLAEVGSASKRMADVYKSKPVWTSFIESDGRGRYRFRVKLR